MRALPLWCLAVTASALAAPARASVDALVSVGACVAESRLAGHRPPVVLRVSPWVGGGAQVTLGVRWDDPLGDTESDTAHARSARDVAARVAQSAAEPSPPRALSINGSRAESETKKISITDAFFQKSVATARAEIGDGSVVGATVIAIDPGSSLATAAAAVETALAVTRGVPRDEEVAVFALVSERLSKTSLEKKQKPLLVADFRAPRLGGARHVERRTRAFLRAFAKQLVRETPDDAVSTDERFIDADDDDTSMKSMNARRLDPARTNGTRTNDARLSGGVFQSSDASSLFDALLGELASWRADPEGPVARDVVLIAPTAPSALRLSKRFDVSRNVRRLSKPRFRQRERVRSFLRPRRRRVGPDDDARGRRGALAAEDLRASDSLERHRQRFACAGHRDRVGRARGGVSRRDRARAAAERRTRRGVRVRNGGAPFRARAFLLPRAGRRVRRLFSVFRPGADARVSERHPPGRR
jgi:hypothetical protein